jgi:hypothetical protein
LVQIIIQSSLNDQPPLTAGVPESKADCWKLKVEGGKQKLKAET